MEDKIIIELPNGSCANLYTNKLMKNHANKIEKKMFFGDGIS